MTITVGSGAPGDVMPLVPGGVLLFGAPLPPAADYDSDLLYDSPFFYDGGDHGGEPLSTYEGWLAVLNQLAGTHGLGELAAVNTWAGSTRLGLEAALNAKHYANPYYTPSAAQPLFEINLVCNLLAGTKNLEPLAALNSLAGNTGP